MIPFAAGYFLLISRPNGHIVANTQTQKSRYPDIPLCHIWIGGLELFFSQYVILILNRQPFFHGFFMPGASASPVPAGGAPSTPDALGRPADGPGRLAPADGARPGATDGLSEERAKEGGGDMGVGELMELIILVYISLYQFISVYMSLYEFI